MPLSFQHLCLAHIDRVVSMNNGVGRHSLVACLQEVGRHIFSASFHTSAGRQVLSGQSMAFLTTAISQKAFHCGADGDLAWLEEPQAVCGLRRFGKLSRAVL